MTGGDMNGLGFIHIETTSVCNKTPPGCPMCGRRKLEREHPELVDWGHMDFDLLRSISIQVPRGIVTQFHWNGDPLCYPFLGQSLELFKNNIRCLNTNGKLLVERAAEIIGNLETLTISVIQDDPEGEEQYDTVCKFLERKGTRRPWIIYRLLGRVDNEKTRWKRLPGFIAKRVIHSPEGSFSYQKKTTIPEIGICLDLLTHLAIDRYGNISLCVRFDPKGELRIGHVETGIQTAWASPKRKKYLEYHIAGRRSELPGCRGCEYWGIPRG
jgi:radical SAM protein with 4Fe4S-binding SPASM domain